MPRKMIGLGLAVVAASSFFGCGPLIDAKVDEPEVCVTQNLAVPGAPGPQQPMAMVGSNDQFSLPELPSGQNLTVNVKLTRAQIIAPAGGDLSFLRTFSVKVASMQSSLMDGVNPSPGNLATLDLNVDDTDNLAALFTGHNLAFNFTVTGQIPAQNSTLGLNTCVQAQAEAGVSP